MPHEGAGGDPCKVLLHPYLLPFLRDFGAGWALGAPHGAPWAVCRGHPIISSPSPLPCSKSILSSRRWRRSMEGSEAAPSLPASSPHFWRSGMGGVLGIACGAGNIPKPSPHHLFPASNPPFPTRPGPLAFGFLMEELQENLSCSASNHLQLWGPSCRFGIGSIGFGVGVSPAPALQPP